MDHDLLIKIQRAAVTDNDLDALLSALSDDDQMARELACEGLRQLADPRAIAQLSRVARKDSEPRVRDLAVEALGDIDSPEVIDPLISALHDPDAKVRQTAARQLGRLQYPQTIEQLSSIIESDPEVVARSSAIEALRSMVCYDNKAWGVEAVIAALQDESTEVRLAAATALQYFETESSYPALIRALDDPDPRAARAAANTLGEIESFHSDDPVVIEKIQRLLSDK